MKQHACANETAFVEGSVATAQIVYRTVEMGLAFGCEVIGDPAKHLRLRAGRNERHDVPGEDGRIEGTGDPLGLQIQSRQVRFDPPRPGIVHASGSDQHRISVNAHDVVTTSQQRGAGSTLTAARVEHMRSAGEESIEESGLAVEVGAIRAQRAKVLGVPLGVAVVRFGGPSGRIGHGALRVGTSYPNSA